MKMTKIRRRRREEKRIRARRFSDDIARERETPGAGRAAKFKFPERSRSRAAKRSEAAPAVVGAATRRNSIKVLAHGPKEMPFSRISRSLSGGTTAYVGPGQGATRASVHGRERSQCPL